MCCSAAVLAPGQTSPRATKYKNYKGLKITACMRSWGKFWTKDNKKRPKNPTATSEEPGATAGGQEQKQGYCACLLHSAKGWAKHLSHPSGQTPGLSPTLTPYKEPAPSYPPTPRLREQAGEPVVLPPPCCSRGLSKALSGL